MISWCASKLVGKSLTSGAIAAGLGTLKISISPTTESLGGYAGLAGYQTLQATATTVLSVPLRIGLSVFGSIIVDMIFPEPCY